MTSFMHRLITYLLFTGLLGALWLGEPGGPRVAAQEADTEVPLVNVGGPVHADLFTGQATTSIPIEVPPGRNGLQPNLALVYGSANGNGWVGMGWKLEKGVIERNLKFGVDYDADDYVFRLNGVNVELVNIGTDEYRAKIEGGFTRIEKTTDDSPDGRPYFIATDTRGVRYIFGKAQESRVFDDISTAPDAKDRIFRWCLERVEDPHGNFMTFTYTRDQNQSYLASIWYTGHSGLEPTNLVEFQLEDGDRDDAPTLYTTHFPITTAKRLQQINVRSNSSSTTVGPLQRFYTFDYGTQGVTGRSRLTQFQQLGGNGETDLPPMTFDYVGYPLTFSEFRLNDIPLVGVECQNSLFPCPNNRQWVPRGPIIPADITGTGRVALVVPKLPTQQINESAILTASMAFLGGSREWHTPGTPTNLGITTHQGNWLLNKGPLGMADITGDGAAEFYEWREESQGVWKIVIYVATWDRANYNLFNFTWEQTIDPIDWEAPVSGEANYRIGFADVNGDGSADFWGWRHQSGPHGGEIEVRLFDRETKQFGAPQRFLWNANYALNHPIGFADVNGDGAADFWGWGSGGHIHYHVADGDGTFTPGQPFAWVVDANREHPVGFADINGDGLADFWGWALEASPDYQAGRVYYKHAKGTGATGQEAFAAPGSVPWTSTFYDTGRIGFADINGDGKADLYGWKVDNDVTYHLAQGDGTLDEDFKEFDWAGTWTEDGPIGFADLNGDGSADFWGWTHGDNGVDGTIDVQVMAGVQKQDLLEQVTNGVGGITDVVYTSQAHTSLVDYAHDQLPFPLFTVKQIMTNDGKGNEGTSTYTHLGGYYHIEERDFRGFWYAREEGPLGGSGESRITENWFHRGNGDETQEGLDVPHGYWKGAPYQVDVFDGQLYVDEPGSTAGLLRRTLTDYLDDEDGEAPFFTPPERIVTEFYEESSKVTERQTDYTYDQQYGNLLEVQHKGDPSTTADDRTITRTFALNPSTWIVSLPKTETISQGLGAGTPVARTQFLYDGGGGCAGSPDGNTSPTKGNLTARIEGLDGEVPVSTGLGYDTYGNVTCTRDANGHVTTTGFDPTFHTFPTTVTNAKGHATITSYHGVPNDSPDGLYGQIASITDHQNNTTEAFQYDAFGRVTTVTHPDLLTTVTTYSPLGAVGTQHVRTERHIDPTDTLFEERYFDGVGQTIEVRTSGEHVQTIYDARGAVHQVSVPSLTPTYSKFTRYEYDPLGRVLLETRPDTSTQTTCYHGWARVTLDAEKHQRRTVHDAFGRVITVQEFTGPHDLCDAANPGNAYATTTYQYDALDNLRVVTDAHGNDTEMLYDSRSRKIDMRDPDMGHWQYAYDGAGNLIHQIDAQGQSLSFEYDALNRRIKKILPGEADVIYSYDNDFNDPETTHGVGRLTQLVDGSGTTRFSYDARGRVNTTVKTVGSHTFTTHTEYDGLDRETRRTYPDGTHVDYEYVANRPWLKVVKEGGTTYALFDDDQGTSDYTALGQPKFRETGDNWTTTYAYDEAETFRLMSLVRHEANGQPYQTLGYEYDDVGNVDRITDTRFGPQVPKYDELNRLREITITLPNQTPEVITYQYDAIGNLEVNDRVGSYEYPPDSACLPGGPHAVCQAGGQTYLYDGNGNRRVGADRLIAYDAENRPVQITTRDTSDLIQVVVTVAGDGWVQSDRAGLAEGIQCQQDCEEIYGIDATTPVTLTATPFAGGTFVGWGGLCSGTGATCVVPLTQSAQVTATFSSNLSVTVMPLGNGNGTVSSADGMIDCGAACGAVYASGTMVTLTATAASGSIFTGWQGGGCQGTDACAVTVNESLTVTATFVLMVPGDVDGDGNPDLVLRQDTGFVALWLMNAQGTVGSTVNVSSLVTEWTVIAVEDMNADGIPDLLLRKNATTPPNENPGFLHLWVMTNQGTVASGVNVSDLSRTWTVVDVVDINGDGIPDLLLRLDTGFLALWFMNSQGTVASAVNVSDLSMDWAVLAVKDMNRDGTPDLLLRHVASGWLHIWYMTPKARSRRGWMWVGWEPTGTWSVSRT